MRFPVDSARWRKSIASFSSYDNLLFWHCYYLNSNSVFEIDNLRNRTRKLWCCQVWFITTSGKWSRVSYEHILFLFKYKRVTKKMWSVLGLSIALIIPNPLWKVTMCISVIENSIMSSAEDISASLVAKGEQSWLCPHSPL